MPSLVRTLTAASVICLLGLMIACQPEDATQLPQHYTAEEYAILQESLRLPNTAVSYMANLPLHMLVDQRFRSANTNDDKAQLGRVLFYDKNLSHNRKVSCASCHRQELAFADDQAFSVGFDGRLTSRNSLALAVTPGFAQSYSGGFLGDEIIQPANFFWDERAFSISEQSSQSLTDPVEMGMEDMHEVTQRVQQLPYYPILFEKAYGDSYILSDRILEALQEFVNALASGQSRFDKSMDQVRDVKKDFKSFSDMENIGKVIYIKNCASCHGSRMVGVTQSMANNGLELHYADAGRSKITGDPTQEGVFKVPMLRNVALTAPYMHDGRFATLEEVIEHYNSGIQFHPNLSFLLRDERHRQSPKRLNLTEYQKKALVAFLHTLTDEAFIRDERFSDPFK